MKYDKRAIMKRAHDIRKAIVPKPTMSEALRSSWAEAKNSKTTLDVTAHNLFRVRAMLDRLAKEEAALMDEIKAAIAASGTDNIAGYGWKASWKDVESKRFDSKAFRTEHADLYATFSKPQTCKRFLFGAV